MDISCCHSQTKTTVLPDIIVANGRNVINHKLIEIAHHKTYKQLLRDQNLQLRENEGNKLRIGGNWKERGETTENGSVKAPSQILFGQYHI